MPIRYERHDVRRRVVVTPGAAVRREMVAFTEKRPV